jgi:hypothetical protein
MEGGNRSNAVVFWQQVLKKTELWVDKITSKLTILSVQELMDKLQSCIFCNNNALTKEHIIPQWIQKSYSLSDLKVRLWNGTFIPYKQITIPACQDCNGNVLSRLELRVQKGIASEMDYYLWALKIRYCLSIKDSTLLFDITDPKKGPLLKKKDAEIGIEFIKYAFANFEKSNFHFNPNPFGSVFIFDNPLDDHEFGFADVPHPYWGLTVSLPNKKILSVLFTDRGMVKKEVIRLFKNKGGVAAFFKKTVGNTTTLTARLLMFKLMLWQYKFDNIPYGYKLNKSGIASHRIPLRVNYRKKLKKEVLLDMASILSLPHQDALDLYNSLPKHYQG